MKTHKVTPGDCCSKLAEQYGFHEADAIYSHTSNAALKAKRDNPNLLCKNDKVIIPEKKKSSESCADSTKHCFKAQGIRTHLRFLVEDFEGNALSGKSYELEVGNDKSIGTTGSDGLIEHLIHAGHTKGNLLVWLDGTKTKSILWPLEIGYLEPHTENSGVQSRLNNLGYDCGKVDAVIGKKTKSAIHAFKKKNGLADDDVLDTATRDKIKEIYGL
jgi:hypothetical protein